MKTKVYQSSKRGIALFFAAFAIAFTSLQAQVLIPATSYEDVYPAGPPTGNTPHCYSFGNINFGGSAYDIYLAGIDGSVTWRMTTPGNPSSVFNQGVIPYSGCVDISVGFNYDTGSTPIAVVSYYKNGTGHFYDVYKWTTGGLSLISSTQISWLTSYTRISMDSHKTYGIVIVWEEASDIYALTGLNGVFNGPIFLGGTAKKKRPDVAFSHTSSGLNVHFVYNFPTGPGTTDIYESVADFFILNGSLSYIPTVQDINPVAAAWSVLTANIDCPDHYSVENWAYSYAVDGAHVYTRSIDFNGLGSAITTNMVNGTVGNAPMVAKELDPRIAYNQSCVSFHVTWYSSYLVLPYGQCYYTQEIKESAGPGSLLSSADYELVAANSAFPPGASLNSIAFSKQNDATDFLYTVFLDNGGLHHVFHKWPQTTSFRNSSEGSPASLADHCSASQGVAAMAKSKVAKELSVGPNPFAAQVNLFVPASLNRETMSVRLTDIAGKLLLSYEGTAGDAPAAVEQASRNLKAGTYLLNTSVKSANLNQNFKLQCVGTETR